MTASPNSSGSSRGQTRVASPAPADAPPKPDWRPRLPKRPSTGRLLAGGAALLLAWSALESAFIVSETERGLRYTFGSLDTKAASDVLQPGLHWLIPFAQTARLMPVDTQSLTMNDVRTYTRDTQEMTARLVVNYRLAADQLVRIAKENPDFEQKLDEMTQDRFKKVLGTKESANIANTRREVLEEVTDYVASGALELYGVRILDVQMPNFAFTQQFETAVELAAIEKTKVKAQEQIRAQEAIKAETAKIKAAGQADAAIEAARGRANSIKLEADAVAYKIEREGQAQAEASRALAAAIATNAGVVQYKFAERWNGQYPMFIGGESMMPILQPDLGGLPPSQSADADRAAAAAARTARAPGQ